MTYKLAICAILLTMTTLGGCANRNKTTVGLDVDLYVHPTSADPMDIILQTAISKRLSDSRVGKVSLVHVRVEDKVVILTGTATAEARKEAERIAEQTELTLNGEMIRPKMPITNRITTQ
jgi:BON domain-containing protein